MWNYIKSLVSHGNDQEEDEGLSETEDEIVESFKNSRCDKSDSIDQDDFEVEDKVGVITQINGNVALIDDVYCFHLTQSVDKTLEVNDKVKFRLYSNELNSIAKNLEKVDLVDFTEENKNSDEREIVDHEGLITLTGQIFNRNKRLFEVKLNNSNKRVHFNLNSVQSEFIPSLGDFVDLDVIGASLESQEAGDLPEIKVIKVRPQKTALKMGVITSWDDKYGTISNFAIFNLSVCEPGFSPGVGCKVCASLVRSDCINGYTWRAIQVIPQTNTILNSSLSNDKKRKIEDEFRNKGGVSISICQKFTLDLYDCVEFKIEVNNKSSSEKVFTLYSDPPSDNSQVKFLYPDNTNITIKAGDILDCPFKIYGKFVGKSYEDFIWDFGDFRIRRRINIDINCKTLDLGSNADSIYFESHFSKRVSSKNVLGKREGRIVPGRGVHKGKPFIPVKVGTYQLPKTLVEILLPENKPDLDLLRREVEQYYPCLKLGLSPETYTSYMHALLFLEEVDLLKKIALLDIDNASFRRYLDFLILDVPEHSFYTKLLVTGDSAIVSLPWNKEQKMEGTIHRITKSEIWFKFAEHFHSDYREGSCYFTTFVKSRTSARREHQSIDVAVKFLGYEWLFPSGVVAKSPQVTFDEYESGISPFDIEMIAAQNENNLSNDDPVVRYMGRGRGKFLTGRRKSFWNCEGSGYGRSQNVREFEPDMNTAKAKKIRWFNPILNVQQKHAVLRVLFGVARPLPYIIFGPPGTGKTVTVVEAILQVHKLHPKSRILVCTPTNSAADLIGQRLMDEGDLPEGDFLRLVGNIYAEQGRLISSLVPFSATPSFNDRNENVESNDDLPSFNRHQIGEFRIIVSTLQCSGTLFSMGFPRGYFTHIFIDEAGQATEPQLLISLTFLSPATGNVILSGDPLQLGPVILSALADIYGLKDSFLVRILSRFPYARDPQGFPNNCGFDPRLVTKLINNYRSLDGILQVFNTLFYNGDLVTNVSNDSSEEANLIASLKSFNINCPVIFHGVRGTSLQERDSKSLYNPQEVFQVFCYLNKLYYDGISPDKIGIVTPYQLQVQKIQGLLESNNLEAPKIGSVEEFQGQERMVIIISVVKSLDDPADAFKTNFINDPRRVNVAISRARALLIIIGDPETLDLNKHWHRILKYCVVNKSYVGCRLPERLTSSG